MKVTTDQQVHSWIEEIKSAGASIKEIKSPNLLEFGL